jgi:hypothetical protein
MEEEMSGPPQKQPNIFGQVPAAILVAAFIFGLIGFFVWLYGQYNYAASAHREAQEILRRELLAPRISLNTPRPVRISRPGVTLTHEGWFKTQRGPFALSPGQRVELLDRDGDQVRLRYHGKDFFIPISATDLK